MIQRIQTIYLLLTMLLPVLFLKFNLIGFISTDGNRLLVKFRGLYSSGPDQVIYLIKQLFPASIIIALIPMLSLVTIFLFRNRKFQMKLTAAIIVLVSGLIITEAIYSLLIIREFDASITPDLMMTVPVLILVFSVLAYRSIMKDEKLVKSYDRLR